MGVWRKEVPVSDLIEPVIVFIGVGGGCKTVQSCLVW
jgi:hypothetical protein